jgi:hypothetical protein
MSSLTLPPCPPSLPDPSLAEALFRALGGVMPAAALFAWIDRMERNP